MKKCVYAGSFDPVTTGHEEIIKKCSSLFDKTYVALCENPEKKYCFSVAERLDFLKAVCAKYAGVEVVCHEGLLVDLMKEKGAIYNVRGLRDERDLAYENEMAYFNSEMYPEMTTVYLPCSHKNALVSSSAVRTLIKVGGDATPYVPKEIAAAVSEKYKK